MRVLRWAIRLHFHSKEKLWKLFDAFNEDKIYVANVSDILQKYIDFKIDDIEEFAATYTYDFHDTRRILDNKKSKEHMYNRVYKMMKALEEKGSLDR
ncbi:hypothetical protein MTsPCn5_16940 [Croceitalea sp. MTPC5]|uniref:Uncharacterized protein n=1 Tax=Croceitalea marina TaxID=1775166 RepID=A0ABW5MY96_9FLAO|nr:hypothetical protein MTsPCn5_16940 [Croceitalea sp. MTPC5]